MTTTEFVDKNGKLPEWCFTVVPGNRPGQRIAKVKLGYEGYFLFGEEGELRGHDVPGWTEDQCKQECAKLNAALGVTPLQTECMSSGSMFGWDVPGADPDYMAKHMTGGAA